MFDVESLLIELTGLFKTQLASDIAAINTEKGAPTLMTALDTNAWLMGSLDDSVKNYNEFMFYYVDDVQIVPNGPFLGKTYTLEYDLFISQKEDFNDYVRVLRYWEAMSRTAKALWDKVGKGYDRPTVSLLNPIDVKLNDSSYWHKVIGIRFEFTIAN